MIDSRVAPAPGACNPLPPLSLPAGDRKSGAGDWRRRGVRPAFLVALYVGVGLAWVLLGGDGLATAWIDGAPRSLPFSHLLAHALFVVASGAFFYGLLHVHASILHRTARDRDIRLAEFIEQITDVAFIKDREGRYLAFNSAGARLTGRPLAECLGRDDSELFPTAVARKLMEDDRRVLATGAGFDCEDALTIGDDTLVFQSTKWPYRDADGRIVGVVGIARDSTALKRAEEQLRRANDALEERVQMRTAELTAINRTLQAQIAARVEIEYALRDSEERFRQLAEHIREVFWVYGIAEQRVLYVSPAYEEIWGRPAQSLLEQPREWIEAVHPDDRPRVRAAHVEKLASGVLDEEYRIIRPDGAVRWIWDRGFPIRDAAGHIYRIAGLAEDTTARKLAEDQLRRQQVELAKTSRLSLAVEMAANLAHDINQPLAAIVAYAQASLNLLRQDWADPRELTGAIDEIVNQGLRAGGIIRHLRDLVRKHPAAQTAIHLNPLIHAVVHYAQLELRQGGVTPGLELAESLPAVLADDIQVQLVVLYLIRNAVEAMHEIHDGPRELTLRTVLLESNTVLVTVCDTGPGLDAEAFARLFQPFFSTKPNGMGLSLSVSRSIIESQGGQLWATPNPDRGLSFHFTLPVHSARRPPPAP